MRSRRHYLYLIRSLHAVKIGISHFPLSRFDSITREERNANRNHGCIQLLACITLKNAYTVEQALHKRYTNQRLHGEWFALTTDQVLDLIEIFYKLVNTPNLDRVLEA